jgi:hypothetical protein
MLRSYLRNTLHKLDIIFKSSRIHTNLTEGHEVHSRHIYQCKTKCFKLKTVYIDNQMDPNM